MAELPILPLMTDALLADTSHMTPEQFGAYVRILLVAWRHGAKLENDPNQLARIVGVSRASWAKLAPVVLAPMVVTETIITQKRLTDTWNRVQDIRRQRAVAGANRWKGKRR